MEGNTNTILVELRAAKRLSRAAVAKTVGITAAYYGMLESGKRKMTVKVAKKLADAYKTNWLKIYEGC